jgi:hypothetical protein
MGTSVLTRLVVVYSGGLPSGRFYIKDYIVSSETVYKVCMNNNMEG